MQNMGTLTTPCHGYVQPCLIGHVPRARCLPVRAGVDGAEGGPVHWFVPALPEFRKINFSRVLQVQ